MSPSFIKGLIRGRNKSHVPLNRPKLPSLISYVFYLTFLWRNKQLTNRGHFHNLLTSNIRDYLGGKNVMLYSNGHLALEAAIQTIEKKRRNYNDTIYFCIYHTSDCKIW